MASSSLSQRCARQSREPGERRFPVHATLSLSVAVGAHVWGYHVIIRDPGLAGGVASLVLSYALPNQLQRLDVREKMTSIGRATADLTTNVKSRLAVLVAVERTRLNRSSRNSERHLAGLRPCAGAGHGRREQSDRTPASASSSRSTWCLGACGRGHAAATDSVRSNVVAAVEKVQVLLQKAEPTANDIQGAARSGRNSSGYARGGARPAERRIRAGAGQRVGDILTTVNCPLSGSRPFTRIDKAVPRAADGAARRDRRRTYSARPARPLSTWQRQKVVLMANYVKLAEGRPTYRCGSDSATTSRRYSASSSWIAWPHCDRLTS